MSVLGPVLFRNPVLWVGDRVWRFRVKPGMTRGMMVFGAQRPRGFGGSLPQWIKEARSADGFKSCGTRRESARRLAGAFFASWPLQDLNLRPADYESAAANQLS